MINDTFGHHAGDEVLFAAAGVVDVIRPEDTLARYGGDEFTILCENLASDSDAEEIARPRCSGPWTRGFRNHDRARPRLQSVRAWPSSRAGGCDPRRRSLQAADTAMYEGKRAGKATLRVVRVGTRRFVNSNSPP